MLDATTGQNAMQQAKYFTEAVGVTGVLLSKLDGTAKGGVVFSVCDQLGVPVRFVGTGERPQDLAPFEPRQFVEALFRLPRYGPPCQTAPPTRADFVPPNRVHLLVYLSSPWHLL